MSYLLIKPESTASITSFPIRFEKLANTWSRTPAIANANQPKKTNP